MSDDAPHFGPIPIILDPNVPPGVAGYIMSKDLPVTIITTTEQPLDVQIAPDQTAVLRVSNPERNTDAGWVGDHVAHDTTAARLAFGRILDMPRDRAVDAIAAYLDTKRTTEFAGWSITSISGRRRCAAWLYDEWRRVAEVLRGIA